MTKHLLLISLTICLLCSACNKAPNSSSAKHYQLKGKVVSFDARAKMVNIDSEAIPGFMDAMTMPYQVKPESELEKLRPGDSITADLVVQDERAWLQNISISSRPDSSGKAK